MNWIPYGDGFIGILDCGIAFAFITRHGIGYTVRFGLAESPHLIHSVEDAKIEAIVLARRVLGDCLREL